MCVFPAIFNAQTYTINDVDKLLSQSEKDSIAKIERLAAKEFHKLINEYRVENNLTTISWDETLWIACRNHNSWMAESNNLSHHQTNKNKNFTGINPSDRFNYAAGGRANNSWSGENALYNYSANGKTIAEIAKNIAETSFTQWKNSPGHNENMLESRHAMHGVAFILNGGKVWGTDLFASGNIYYQPNDNEPKYAATKTTIKTVRFSPTKTLKIISADVTKQVASSQTLKAKNINTNGEAYKQAHNLLAKRIKTNNNGVLLEEQDNTRTKGFLGLFAKDIDTYTLVLERDLDDFNAQLVSKELAQLIVSKQTFTVKSKLDLGFALKKKKNIVRITLVSRCYNPKSKVAIFI
jgi:uncharacterized protein YkwD